MFWIFLSLAIVDALVLASVVISGFWVSRGLEIQTHIAAGLIGAVYTLFTHSLVFIYFMGSGKSLQEAVLRTGIDSSLLQELPALRRQSFPWAWTNCSLTVVAAILGGGIWTGLAPTWLHRSLALITLACVWVGSVFEAKAIWKNGLIINRVRQQMAKLPQSHTEEKVEEHLGMIPLGKGLIITGFSIWGLFAYLRWIMKEPVEVFPWFFLVSAFAIVSGWFLSRGDSKEPNELSLDAPEHRES